MHDTDDIDTKWDEDDDDCEVFEAVGTLSDWADAHLRNAKHGTVTELPGPIAPVLTEEEVDKFSSLLSGDVTGSAWAFESEIDELRKVHGLPPKLETPPPSGTPQN